MWNRKKAWLTARTAGSFFVECGVFWQIFYFWFLYNFFIQELSLL